MGCTIGAKVLRRGSEVVMFKNKDLYKQAFDDQLVVEAERFGVMGVHLPPNAHELEEIRSGFSIGVNAAGVAACNSHVKSLEGGDNYDLLTEAAVTGTSSARQAVAKVADLAARASYNWSNIVISDPNEVAIVEVGDDAACAEGATHLSRANGHLLPHDGRPVGTPCARGQRAIDAVGRARGVDDFCTLLRSHEGEEGRTRICKHGDKGRTVYSYVLHWRDGAWTLYVTQNAPCLSEYVRIPLTFPLDDAALAAYPTSSNQR